MAHFDGVLKVRGDLLTPLAQLTKIGNKETGLKTRTFIVEIDNAIIFVDVPIFSSNGVSGILRRAGTYLIFKKAIEKGYISELPYENPGKDEKGKIQNPIETNGLLALYYLYTVGGGSVISLSFNDDYSLYRVTKELTERNPFASLFGVTLNVPSKLIISDWVPFDVINNPTHRQAVIDLAKKLASEEGEDSIIRISAKLTSFANTETIVVVDDIQKGGVLTKLFLTDRDKDEWTKFTNEKTVERKKQDSSDQSSNKDNSQGQGGEGKGKKGTIQNIQDMPYTPAGAVITGEVSVKEPLNPVEYGLLLRSLEILARQYVTDMNGKKYRIAFGSFAKRGFGRVKLSIKRQDGDTEIGLLTVENKRNVFDMPYVDINTVYDLEAEALESFDEWLENMSYEDFVLPLTFSQTYASKAIKK